MCGSNYIEILKLYVFLIVSVLHRYCQEELLLTFA